MRKIREWVEDNEGVVTLALCVLVLAEIVVSIVLIK